MTAVPLRAKDEGLAQRANAFVAAVTWNPIVSKELRSRMRGWHAFALLTGYLCVIGGLGWIVYDSDIGSSGNVVGLGSTGAQVFRALAGVVMATVALVVPGLVGPTISGERERQTLDLLLVTPLGPGRIVLGKLIAALAFVVLLVIACLPLFSVAFLLGGVGIAEVLEVVAFTLVGAITIGALSMLISVLLRRVSSATVVSYLVMLALTVRPIAAGYLLNRALSEPAQSGPAPFSIAEVNGTTGIVEAVSPAVGAASLLDAVRLRRCGPVLWVRGRGADRRRLRAGRAVRGQHGRPRDLAGLGRYLPVGRCHCCGGAECERASPEPAGGGVKPEDDGGAGWGAGWGVGRAAGGYRPDGSTVSGALSTEGGIGDRKPAFWARQPHLVAVRSKKSPPSRPIRRSAPESGLLGRKRTSPGAVTWTEPSSLFAGER